MINVQLKNTSKFPVKVIFKKKFVLFLSIFLGVQNEQVRILANQTLKSENEKIISEIPELDFLQYGTPQRLKRFSMDDFFLQLYRLFLVFFVKHFNILILQILIYIVTYISLIFLFDPEMTKPDGCYSMTNNNMTCAEQLNEDYLMNSYVIYQAFAVMLMGYGTIVPGAMVFAPLLKVFRNEHRNRWYSLGTFFVSYWLIGLVEMTIFTILNTTIVYFASGHHYIDNVEPFNFNFNRFFYFFGNLWLFNFYMQSIGQLASTLFLENVEISLIMANVYFIVFSMLNGYLIILEQKKNLFLLSISNFFSFNTISKALLWSFYGLDRCSADGVVSIILQKYYISPDTLSSRLIQMIINSIVLRLVSIILMLIRFSISWNIRPMIKSSIKQQTTIDYLKPKYTFKIRTPLQFRIKKSEEIEFEKFSQNKLIIAWRDLTLFTSGSIHEVRSHNHQTNKQKHSKVILHNLNGQFRFGTMNGLMGTSGSGKTSFLKVLSGYYKTQLSDETRIYLSRFTPTRICYLTQDVSRHLLPGLTAKQSLIYASKLKNSCRSLGNKVDHEEIAVNLLDELALTEISSTLTQNCSGGERKRLALALELTSLLMPNLICIDEPTSGLDSNSAEIVISCLKEFVHKHKITIIASVHQPNTDLLKMFDEIYVLARGGVCIYSGLPTQIRQHFSQIPGFELSDEKVPIDELIKYSCSNFHSDLMVQELVSKNDLNIKMKNTLVETETQFVSDGIPLNRIRFSLNHLAILCHRYFSFTLGYQWHQWISYFGIYIFYAIILRLIFDSNIGQADGCISLEDDFNQICNRTEERIQNETKLWENGQYIFFAFNIFSLFVMFQYGLSFMKEFQHFFNEHHNGNIISV